MGTYSIVGPILWRANSMMGRFNILDVHASFAKFFFKRNCVLFQAVVQGQLILPSSLMHRAVSLQQTISYRKIS